MTADALQARIDAVDRAIRAAEHRRARALLARLVARRPPRAFRARAASLARRLRDPELALRLLHSTIYPQRPTRLAASDEEKAEYAASLIRLGAVGEARRLLAGIDADQCPTADLFTGFASIHEWDYEAALAPLGRYLDLVPHDSYEARVAEVNLAAALVATGRSDRARATLLSLTTRAEAAGDRLLRGNLLELRAQNEIVAGDTAAARAVLGEADRLLRDAGLDGFFVAKWEAVCALLDAPDSPSARHRAEAARDEALRLDHWETVRDLDYRLAVARRDAERLIHLWHGTPMPVLRSRYEAALRALGIATVPARHARILGPIPPAAALVLATGESGASSTYLKPGQLLHRLVSCLNRDYYRPRRLHEIHEAVYPGECFSPISSRNRLHQAMARLRRAFREMKLPLDVSERGGFFSLVARDGSVALVAGPPAIATASPPLRSRLDAFRAAWGEEDFRARDFSARTATPKRTAVKYLSEAFRTGLVVKAGTGVHTVYRFTRAVNPPSLGA